MRELIRAEQLAAKVTTVYVTHDQEEAMSLADRVVVMEGGRIRQIGTPAEVYDHPADLFVARFVGSPGMNLIQCRFGGEGGRPQLTSEPGGIPLEVPPDLAKGTPTTPHALLGVRCEHVHEDPKGPIPGLVLTEEYFGSARLVHVDTPCGKLVLRAEAGLPRSLGSLVRLSLDPAQLSLFDGATEARL
jgi:ABC-type sugar transport system ATPase subunit